MAPSSIRGEGGRGEDRTASDSVPGPASQLRARLAQACITAHGGGGPGGPGRARGWECHHSRGAGLVLSLGLCCRHLGILDLEGRGLGPSHPLAVLRQESSVRELGPRGAAPPGSRLRELLVAGWVALCPPGRVAGWASRPGLSWGGREGADAGPRAGRFASTAPAEGRQSSKSPTAWGSGTLWGTLGAQPPLRHPLDTKLAGRLHPFTGLRNSSVFWVPSRAAQSRCSVNRPGAGGRAGGSGLQTARGWDGACSLRGSRLCHLLREGVSEPVSPGLGEVKDPGGSSPMGRTQRAGVAPVTSLRCPAPCPPLSSSCGGATHKLTPPPARQAMGSGARPCVCSWAEGSGVSAWRHPTEGGEGLSQGQSDTGTAESSRAPGCSRA